MFSIAFVILTLLCRVMIRAAAIIGIRVKSGGESLRIYIGTHSSGDPLVCTYNLAYVMAIIFFSVALVLNAIRWIDIQ